jgi:hypothetical protein
VSTTILRWTLDATLRLLTRVPTLFLLLLGFAAASILVPEA